MNLRPLGNRLILNKKANERIVGGIVLPENAKESTCQGEVVAVGEGRYRGDKLIPIDLKAGDNVIYKKNAFSIVNLDEEGNQIIIDIEDILAVKEDD